MTLVLTRLARTYRPSRFRWADCQLGELRKCVKQSAVKKTLETLPPTLDETYTRILLSIDKVYRHDVARVLQFLVYSAEPLRIHELAEIVAFDSVNPGSPSFAAQNRLREPQDILSLCSSLITVRMHGLWDQRVQLSHYSVKEFLISERIRSGEAASFFLEHSSHAFLSQACLSYVMNFQEPIWSIDERDDLVSAYPLAEYASRNWAFHTARALTSTEAESTKRVCMRYLTDNPVIRNNCELILDFDEDLVFEDQYSPLYYLLMINEDFSPIIDELIRTGADVNADPEGPHGSPLEAALFYGRRNIVDLLFSKGAVLNLEASAVSNLYDCIFIRKSFENDYVDPVGVLLE